MEKINYSALERLTVPRPVDRLDFISSCVSGKRVLDLGAYDETALDNKDKKYWLHGRIAETAEYVIGIDNSDRLPNNGVVTSEKSKIVKISIFDIHKIIEPYDIDILVAGELIEHLPDTLSFLSYIKSFDEFKNKKIILTTPNASCLSNLILGMFGMENNDVNHLQIYSLKTLNTLFTRAGFQGWEFQPYHEIFPEMVKRSRGLMKIATIFFQKIVNLGEFCCPLLSGGWIATITI